MIKENIQTQYGEGQPEGAHEDVGNEVGPILHFGVKGVAVEDAQQPEVAHGPSSLLPSGTDGTVMFKTDSPEQAIDSDKNRQPQDLNTQGGQAIRPRDSSEQQFHGQGQHVAKR